MRRLERLTKQTAGLIADVQCAILIRLTFPPRLCRIGGQPTLALRPGICSPVLIQDCTSRSNSSAHGQRTPVDHQLAALTVKVFDPQGADPALNAAPLRWDQESFLEGLRLVPSGHLPWRLCSAWWSLPGWCSCCASPSTTQIHIIRQRLLGSGQTPVRIRRRQPCQERVPGQHESRNRTPLNGVIGMMELGDVLQRHGAAGISFPRKVFRTGPARRPE
jgi:hypothetical protein